MEQGFIQHIWLNHAIGGKEIFLISGGTDSFCSQAINDFDDDTTFRLVFCAVLH